MRSTWLTTPWSSWTAWSNLSWRGRSHRRGRIRSATLSRDTPAAGWATATDPAVIAARLRLMRPPHARVAQHSTRAVVQPSVAEIGARSASCDSATSHTRSAADRKARGNTAPIKILCGRRIHRSGIAETRSATNLKQLVADSARNSRKSLAGPNGASLTELPGG